MSRNSRGSVCVPSVLEKNVGVIVSTDHQFQNPNIGELSVKWDRYMKKLSTAEI